MSFLQEPTQRKCAGSPACSLRSRLTDISHAHLTATPGGPQVPHPGGHPKFTPHVILYCCLRTGLKIVVVECIAHFTGSRVTPSLNKSIRPNCTTCKTQYSVAPYFYMPRQIISWIPRSRRVTVIQILSDIPTCGGPAPCDHPCRKFLAFLDSNIAISIIPVTFLDKYNIVAPCKFKCNW